MEIGRQDPNLFRNDAAGGGIVFLRSVAGRDDVSVTQVKPGATHEDPAGLVGGSLILSVFQDADGGLFGAFEGGSIEGRYIRSPRA